MNTRILITQMLEALLEPAPTFGKTYAAITAAREYLAAPERSEPNYELLRLLENAVEDLLAIEKRQHSNPEMLATSIRANLNKAIDLCVIDVAKVGFGKALAPQPKAEPVNQMLLEAAKLSLQALEAIGDEMTVGERYTNAGQYLLDALQPTRTAIAAAEQAPQPAELTTYSTCNETLRSQGKPHPRTCAKCGLGQCVAALETKPTWTRPVEYTPPHMGRKPLTDGQISWLWSEAHNDTTDRMAFQVLARSVEAAHGITAHTIETDPAKIRAAWESDTEIEGAPV